jgi:hypothetical protein
MDFFLKIILDVENFNPKRCFKERKKLIFLVKVNEACFLKMFENIRVLTIKMLNLCDDMFIVHKVGFQCSRPPVNTESSWDRCVRRT